MPKGGKFHEVCYTFTVFAYAYIHVVIEMPKSGKFHEVCYTFTVFVYAYIHVVHDLPYLCTHRGSDRDALE